MSAKPRDPFAPIEAAVTALLALIGLTFAVFAGLAVYDAITDDTHVDAHLFAFGSPTCVSVDASGIGATAPSPEVVPLRSGAGAIEESFRICLDHPSWRQQLAASADGIASFVLTLGAGLLILLSIRRARHGGLFTVPAAQELRLLGWFLVAMAIVVPLARAVGAGTVAAAAVIDQHWWGQLSQAVPDVALLLVGLGVITFARILRLAVPLQDEVALTV